MKNKNIVLLKFVLIILIFILPFSVFAKDNETIINDDWEDNSITGSFDYNDISTSSDGTTIIVGESNRRRGKIMYSNDRNNWESVSMVFKDSLVGCAWGDNSFVAASEDGDIFHSENGIEWELVFESKGITFTDIAYGNNGFIAVAHDEFVMGSDRENNCTYLFHSTDGVNWKEVLKQEEHISWMKATYLNNKYIVYCNNYLNTSNSIAHSDDGIIWNIIDIKVPIYNKGLYWDGDKYISVGINSYEEGENYVKDPQIFTSTDLVNWNKVDHNLNEGVSLWDIVYNNGYYIISADFKGKSVLLISKDCIEWNMFSTRQFDELIDFEVNMNSVTFVGEQGTLVTIGDDYLAFLENKHSEISSVTYNGESYIAPAQDGMIYKSNDVKTWVKLKSNLEHGVRDAIWVEGKYYALTYYNNITEIYISDNGITWEEQSEIGDFAKLIRFVNGKFFALGGQNLYWSDDAINWTKVKTSTQSWLSDIEWFKGKYYVISWDGTVLSSSDLETWERKTFEVEHKQEYEKRLNDIETNGESMIVVGNGCQIHFTSDGVNWNSITDQNYKSEGNSVRDLLLQAIWDGDGYVIFGLFSYYKTKDGTTLEKYDADVYSADNGACWDGNRYIIVGEYGSIISHIPKDFIKVKINGKPIIFDVAPKLIDNRTMISAREVFERVGAEVLWDNDTRSVIIVKDDITINIKIGSRTATVNGVNKPLDSPAVIVEGRTLVPVRFIAEQLGMSVEWDGETKTVLLNSDI